MDINKFHSILVAAMTTAFQGNIVVGSTAFGADDQLLFSIVPDHTVDDQNKISPCSVLVQIKGLDAPGVISLRSTLSSSDNVVALVMGELNAIIEISPVAQAIIAELNDWANSDGDLISVITYPMA